MSLHSNHAFRYLQCNVALLYDESQGRNRRENLVATSTMVGRNCPPPGGDRVKVSENLGARPRSHRSSLWIHPWNYYYTKNRRSSFSSKIHCLAGPSIGENFFFCLKDFN